MTVGDLALQQEAIRQREHVMKTKRAKLKAFQGLSPVRHRLLSFAAMFIDLRPPFSFLAFHANVLTLTHLPRTLTLLVHS